MKQPAVLPRDIVRLAGTDSFSFSCHKGVKCFTDCCRMLELALTPYDVLRLRRATGLTSGQLLDRYLIMEQDPGEPFPRFYLTMVDDGRASCVFVTEGGCSVYAHRPGACRAYPLGRAAIRIAGEAMEEHFVLLRESHCHGFDERVPQTPGSYSHEQELTSYNTFNDATAQILQHEAIRQGFIPSAGQVDQFVLALYDLDRLRDLLAAGTLEGAAIFAPDMDPLRADDEQLLLFGIAWLRRQLFPPFGR